MKYVVSIALLVLLLGTPIGCILAGYNPVHPCCPRKGASLTCPYDTLDNAKISGTVTIANIPVVIPAGIVVPGPTVARDLLPEIAEARPDLNILNRILRI